MFLFEWKGVHLTTPTLWSRHMYNQTDSFHMYHIAHSWQPPPCRVFCSSCHRVWWTDCWAKFCLDDDALWEAFKASEIYICKSHQSREGHQIISKALDKHLMNLVLGNYLMHFSWLIPFNNWSFCCFGTWQLLLLCRKSLIIVTNECLLLPNTTLNILLILNPASRLVIESWSHLILQYIVLRFNSIMFFSLL